MAPKPRYVPPGTSGLFLASPPISREDASRLFGCQIDKATWRSVERVYEDHKCRLEDAASAFRDTKEDGKNGARSYNAARSDVAEHLRNASQAVLSTLNDHRATHAIHQNCQFRRMATHREEAEVLESLPEMLREAEKLLARARKMVQEAQPMRGGILSPDEAPARLCRDLFRCLSDAGVPCETSGGGGYPESDPSSDPPLERV